ncbi:hypothetical protein BVRB_006560 [Beta vulgaris subsp. vulgaris]|uniref:Uncharacterized protein n=1 Tax=Beta vulgaris subsp. vulgaris TaxID=3555 RepID=A0A0J8B6Q7_BETVV|nr:hypothetical protein BVRB_006560 [Beta vulgaris subsp. vulgaris]
MQGRGDEKLRMVVAMALDRECIISYNHSFEGNF